MQLQPNQKFLFGAVALTFVSVVWFLVSGYGYQHTFSSVGDHGIGIIDEVPIPSSTPVPTPAPRISIIAIWRGHTRPYLNNFFTSFRANSDTVELLWVGIRGDDEDQCLDISPWTGPPGESNNIKVVCFSVTEYWALHRDYFCASWKCNKGEADLVWRHMIDRGPADSYNSHFRLWRGYVFRHLIHPHVEWWGWVDADTFMGNFQSQFPWDATEYDIVVPAAGGDALLFLRGHLCFFRAGPDTEAKMNLYENLSSMDLYINNHRPYYATEEAEFSAFVIRSPLINFLIVPELLADVALHLIQANTARFSTLHGVYTLHFPWNELLPFPDFPMLSMPMMPSLFTSTLSANGTTYPIEIISGNQSLTGLWFPGEFATYYDIDWSLGDPGWRRFVGRGGGHVGGSQGVWTRLEPPKAIQVHAMNDSSVKVDLAEGLYIHWFEEKHRSPWFKDLPQTPLSLTQTLVTFWQYGAEIWDHATGQVIWRGL